MPPHADPGFDLRGRGVDVTGCAPALDPLVLPPIPRPCMQWLWHKFNVYGFKWMTTTITSLTSRKPVYHGRFLSKLNKEYNIVVEIKMYSF